MSSVASVPHSTDTVRNTCPSKINLPGAHRVYRQVRNEKCRSVRSVSLTLAPSSKAATVRGKSTPTDPLYCDACLAIPAQSKWKEWADEIYFDSDQVRSPARWLCSTPVLDGYQYSGSTLLMHECFPPSNYRMGTTGCRIFMSQPNQLGYGNTDSCKSAHQILSPGNRKIASHLCPDRAMGNTELVQKCTKPSRLCEYNSYKSAHQILAPGNSKNNCTPAARPS